MTSINAKKAGSQSALSMKKKFRVAEFLIEQFIRFTAFISLAVILLIFIFVFRETLPIFTSASRPASAAAQTEVQETYGEEPTAVPASAAVTSVDASEGDASVRNLAGGQWQPVSSTPKFGLIPLVIGSIKVTLVAILIGGPIAIFAALFTSAFAPRWAKETMKPIIEILAGIPSVVIGFFALIVLASFFQNVFGFTYRLNGFVGGVALALAVMPIIYTITDDALSRVPKALTEASLALGASRWETALYVVLPAATPGVFAAILLGIGRAFGETMIVLMATGNAAMVSAGLFEPVRTMTATIGAEMAEVVFGDTHYNVLFLIGSILFLFAFSLNVVAELFVRKRLMKRFEGM
ncbi:MAG TPA: phosphate ABC transporter permease subunit PstC [Bacteroidota bacterium]|nr:phosphate ABC transporter permease subunit PstC [Bacteroidota bacterium]